VEQVVSEVVAEGVVAAPSIVLLETTAELWFQRETLLY
jgi:hypothetical protein